VIAALPWGASRAALAAAMADAAAMAHTSPEAALYARRVCFLARCAAVVPKAVWERLRDPAELRPAKP